MPRRESYLNLGLSGRGSVGGGRVGPKFVTYRDSDVDEKTVRFLRVSNIFRNLVLSI